MGKRKTNEDTAGPASNGREEEDSSDDVGANHKLPQSYQS